MLGRLRSARRRHQPRSSCCPAPRGLFDGDAGLRRLHLAADDRILRPRRLHGRAIAIVSAIAVDHGEQRVIEGEGRVGQNRRGENVAPLHGQFVRQAGAERLSAGCHGFRGGRCRGAALPARSGVLVVAGADRRLAEVAGFQLHRAVGREGEEGADLCLEFIGQDRGTVLQLVVFTVELLILFLEGGGRSVFKIQPPRVLAMSSIVTPTGQIAASTTEGRP